jgi:ribosomal-protein-alanine N-acetyltransferase
MRTDTMPTLDTGRLRLRPYTPADAPHVQRLAGDAAIADTTLSLPHPYLDGMAESWIAKHPLAWDLRQNLCLAICAPDGALRGTINLALTMAHRRGEIGYWIGQEFWGHGFATEATRAIVRFGFTELGLIRIQGMHLTRNPASGRVLEKAGMTREGEHRRYIIKNGKAEDVLRWAIIREDFDAAR